MLISQSVPNLINGVSQQPPALRLASQAEEQINMLSSVVEGLGRRPGTRHVAKITEDALEGAFIHLINRDAAERYIMVADPVAPSLRVFDAFTGTEMTVNATQSALDYIAGAASKRLRAMTVADFTFVLNSARSVGKAEAEPTPNPEAIVVVRSGNYGRTYKVFVNGTQRAAHTTPNGGSASDAAALNTETIATALFTQLTSTMPSQWQLNRIGSTIHMRWPANVSHPDFDIRVEDGQNGNGMVAIKDRIQRFGDLPNEAPSGFKVEITGDQTSSFDNYFVEFDSSSDDASSTGVWKETFRGGEPRAFISEDMPHILVREADGTFSFRAAEWEPRKVGDLDSIAWPSFVERTITDMFFFRNRLGFISDENVILSQASEFFDFWPSTSTTIVDSDPIDLGVSHTRVSILRHAVPFNRSLLLFSDQTQFILEGGEILTPGSSSIGSTTEFEANPDVRPVGVGQYVYFPVARGRHSSVREYFVDGQTQISDAFDVTGHCPRFLPANLKSMVASTSEDTIVALSEDTPLSLWVYRFHFSGEEKLQSSWSRWELPGEGRILAAGFIQSQLFLVVQRPDGTFIETMDIEIGRTDEGSEVHYHMDRKVYEEDLSVTYEEAENQTRIVLPYETNEPLWAIIRAGDEEFEEGLVLDHDRDGANEVLIEGDWTGRRLCIGVRFPHLYVFSPFNLKEEMMGGGQSSIGEGRLQLRFLSVNYARTGYFEVHVTPRARPTSVKTFTGRVLGALSSVLGKINLADGRFKVPLLSRNTHLRIELRGDNWLPCSFLGAEWEGRFTMRSRRM
jgi:hypothetical protein